MPSRFNIYFFTLLFCLGVAKAHGQCGITVDAGPDIFTCFNGGTFTLSGSITGPDVVGYLWTPSTGLSDPTILNPTTNVTTTTTYTLTVDVFDPTNNIITNGDFEMGDTGFTSDYIPGTGGPFGLLSNEGQYAITTNSNLVHNNFANCTDHTGGGSMMVINGATTINENIWCQQVTVTTNTNFVFSAWLQSVNSANPANLQFSINGVLLGGSFMASSTTCLWQEYSQIWNSGSAVTAEICITNQNTIGSGNDFAIDDLFFGPVCEQSDDMTITAIQIVATAPSTLEIPCNPGPLGVILDGTGSSTGPNYSYQWTTANGIIISGQNDIIAYATTPGEYTLTVTYDDGFSLCSESTLVVVTEIPNPTLAMAQTVLNIDCLNSNGVVSGMGSTTGNSIIYAWSTSDGNIVSGASSQNATVDIGGTYLLTIIDLISGCSSTAMTYVAMDTLIPTAIVALPDTINCSPNYIILDGTGSTSGNSIGYNWSTENGGIVNGQATTMAQVNQAGDYTLVVTNSTNNCMDTAQVEVLSSVDLPIVYFNPVDTISCSLLQTQISAIGSSEGANYTFEWSTNNGQIENGANTYMPTVSQGGYYTLGITNTDTNCFVEDSVFVNGNSDMPFAQIDMPDTLTCTVQQLTLAEGSMQDTSNIMYGWSTTEGNITSLNNGQQITVDQFGPYFLAVTDTINGCTQYDTVIIEQNITAPISIAESYDTLNCAQDEVSLFGSGSSVDPQMSYQWSTTQGAFVGNTNTINTQVTLPGYYYLEVRDTINGCIGIDSIEVIKDINAPVALASPLDTLNCLITSIIIDGSGSSFDPSPSSPYVYNWFTTSGNILSGANSISPEVDEPGQYTFTILNLENNCTDTLALEVFKNDTLPIVNAGLPQEIDCMTPQVALHAINSSSGSHFEYNWTTIQGNILGENNLDSVFINQMGDYYLEITNTENGCSNKDTVNVTSTVALPNVIIEPVDTINCLNSSILLIGENSSQGAQINYQWSTNSGNILSNTTQTNIDVNAAGYYVFEIQNEDNGCVVRDSVYVEIDTLSPTILFEDPAPLTCVDLSTEIDAQSSSQGGQYVYTWSTIDGNIVSGANTLLPTVNLIGSYALSITNSENNCSEEQNVEVEEDKIEPIANAGVDTVLDCITLDLDLEGTAIGGGLFDIVWTTTNGQIVTGAHTWTPTVSATGAYTLSLTNQNNGCVGEDQVLVSTTNIDIAFSSSDVNCIEPFGQIVIDTIIGGTAPYLYSIDGGEQFQADSSFPDLEPSSYSIVIQDINGCIKDTTSMIIEAQSIHTSIGNNVEISLGDSYQIQTFLDFDPADIDTIIWANEAGLSCYDCLNPVASPLITTDYTVLVRDNNGCEAMASLTIKVINTVSVFYPNTFSPNGDGVNDYFFPQAPTKSISEVETLIIYDRWGEHLFTQSHFQPNNPLVGWGGYYRGENMPVGVYVFYSKVIYIDGTSDEIEGDLTLIR